MTWPNAVQGGAGATLSGSGLSVESQSGHGADSVVTALIGTTSDTIEFGDVIKTEFTICSVTRYTGGTNRRILTGGETGAIYGESANWFHGHHGDKAGVAFYGGAVDPVGGHHIGLWKTRKDGTNVDPLTDWVFMCGTNAGSQLTLVNGVDKGTADGGPGDVKLWVNGGTATGCCYVVETSDFAIAELMVWDRGLTSEEMYGVSGHLLDKFGMENPSSPTSTPTSTPTLTPTKTPSGSPSSSPTTDVSLRGKSFFFVSSDLDNDGNANAGQGGGNANSNNAGGGTGGGAGVIGSPTSGPTTATDLMYYPDWSKKDGGCKTGGGQPT